MFSHFLNIQFVFIRTLCRQFQATVHINQHRPSSLTVDIGSIFIIELRKLSLISYFQDLENVNAWINFSRVEMLDECCLRLSEGQLKAALLIWKRHQVSN